MKEKDITLQKDIYGLNYMDWQLAFINKDEETTPDIQEEENILAAKIKFLTSIESYVQNHPLEHEFKMDTSRLEEAYKGLLEANFQQIYFTNPKHVEHYTPIITEEITRLIPILKSVELMTLFLKCNQQLLKNSKEKLPIILSPWGQGLGYLDLYSERDIGEYARERKVIHLAIENSHIINFLIHEMTHRLENLYDLKLERLKSFWDTFDFHNKHDTFDLSSFPDINLMKSCKRILAGIESYEEEDEVYSEFFARIFEIIASFGGEGLACVKLLISDSGNELETALEALLLPILKNQKGNNYTFFGKTKPDNTETEDSSKQNNL